MPDQNQPPWGSTPGTPGQSEPAPEKPSSGVPSSEFPLPEPPVFGTPGPLPPLPAPPTFGVPTATPRPPAWGAPAGPSHPVPPDPTSGPAGTPRPPTFSAPTPQQPPFGTPALPQPPSGAPQPSFGTPALPQPPSGAPQQPYAASTPQQPSFGAPTPQQPSWGAPQQPMFDGPPPFDAPAPQQPPFDGQQPFVAPTPQQPPFDGQPSFGAPAPGFPPPAGPVSGGSDVTAIAVTTKYPWPAFLLALFRPFLAVNGHRVPGAWGRTVIPVPPGQHHLHVHVPYLLPSRIGTAELFVPVYPGQIVEVEYRVPLIVWLDGSIGPAPQKYRGLAAYIALMVIPLLLILCMCGLGAIGLSSSSQTTSTLPTFPAYSAPALPTVPTYSAPSGDPTATSGPNGSTSSGSSGSATSGSEAKPTLRSATARTLSGPSYSSSDKTYTMALSGYPFAFRTPSGWGCLAGKIDIEDAKAWVCVDEGNPFDASAPEPDRGKRLQIMLRPCTSPCTAATRKEMSALWFDDGATSKSLDATTSYVEKAKDAKGRYILDMSHFFPSTGTPKYQIAVGVYSQPATKAVVQKIVNDILTQAG
ncbi:hypothetical protein [Actinoplanes rectilineatus]|uniref:hypothetical protein n=1 Tax=Actinoplanes rectilineatus TaxID=113571 RepID=UPI000AAF62CC|nr:hypothetical protein [Actinoplanes rectilineatus]